MSKSPRLSFVIGGVQKAGTSALAAYLSSIPGISLPMEKEAHVFDAPDFHDDWTSAQVDERLSHAFGETLNTADSLAGDATPITMLHERLITRVRRYNPSMRWIILLRHPVDRARSHHAMERRRGKERLPFFVALAAEQWRLRHHLDDFSWESPLRIHSYRLRGDYARQLAALNADFPQEQLLVLRSDDLLADGPDTIGKIHRFLGIAPPSPDARIPMTFVGRYAPWRQGDWRRAILKMWWRREFTAQAEAGIHWPD